MTRPFSRRAFLGTALSTLGSAALAEAPLSAFRPRARPGEPEAAPAAAPGPGLAPEARPEMDDLIAEAGLGGVVGWALADARTGEIHSSGDADVPQPPASVMKSITTLYALDRLGPDYRFTTRVLATAPISEDGTVDGDLILAGGGDPGLDTDQLVTLAQRLRDAGVRRVTGAFEVWGGALPYAEEIEPGQLDHLGYNPAISGLNLNYNRVHFAWERQGGDYRITMDGRSDAVRPEVRMARMTVVDRSVPVYTYENGADADLWTVARGALGDAGSRWLPVRRPAIYAGDVFRTLAAAQGLTLPYPREREGALPLGLIDLARFESAPLHDVAKDMLKWSTNLTAECLGLSATAAGEGTAESLAHSASAMTTWLEEAAGVEARFADHSGLSDASGITAGQMVRTLIFAARDGALKPLLKDIPLTDENGEHLRFSRGEVAAKTGTLNFVSSLAGYITTLEGRDMAFAIFCANPDLRAESRDSDDEMPEGARYWNGRAKRLQQRMLQRWGLVSTVEPQLPEAAPTGAPAASLGGIEPAAFARP